MFSSDSNIETISQLIVEIKKYVELQKMCLQIDFVSKLSKLMAAIVMGAVLFLLGAIALMFISMTLAALLEPHVGGMDRSYAIIVALYAALAYIVYSHRKQWIESPITNFLAHLFLDEQADPNTGSNGNASSTPNNQ